MNDPRPTQRFSNRVQDYVKYRPHYPAEVMEWLRANLGLTSDQVIADVGSGTGISTEFFLKNGNLVYAVEPNAKMRESAEEYLQKYGNFRSIAGASEATGLPDQSMDFVVAAQAFHWFDRVAARQEFCRILKPQGTVVLMWNHRRDQGSAFAEELEQLISDFGTDYQKVKHNNVSEESIREFLGEFKSQFFYNAQALDQGGLLGRLTSASYMPSMGHPRYEALVEAVKTFFEKYQKNNSVNIEYDTTVYGSLRFARTR